VPAYWSPSHFGCEPDESAMERTKNPPTDVAILAFPRASASVVYGMYDLFLCAGRDWQVITDGTPGPCLMRPRVVATGADAFELVNGVRIVPEATLESCPSPEVICVPDIYIAPAHSVDGLFDREIAWLRECYAGGATVATSCSGTLLLAEAGLLDGEEATTHWAYCELFTHRYPRVQMRAQRALVVAGDGGRLVMAGGGTSWLDLALYLIARYAGVDAAMQVARLNLIDWHHVGQQPFARLARSRQVEDAVVARCQSWIAERYESSAPVAAMVKLSGLAERSFVRRFKQATGLTPLEYVHTVRLEEAKQMLEAGAEPVEAIANAVGYEDAGFFSRLFRRKVGLTPTQYRKRFGSLRQALRG
jgi:transcriptional regulator GlxA family with amidase domain